MVIVFVMMVALLRGNAPLVVGDWTKQTMYLWLIDCCHIQDKKAAARFMLIDDDSDDGVFAIKQICDELHIKATFAVLPNIMSKRVCDSLRYWQKEGFGIAIHGYDHNDWRNKTYKEIIADINKCEKRLASEGFDCNKIGYVVTPHSSNNKDIRNAVKDKKYQMVMGANLVNPDTTVFQLGRLFITHETDLDEIESILRKAKKRNCYIIFGTHSSKTEEFSKEKTKAVLKMAINMGFEYN